jgi:hypothetical protein
MIPPPPAVYEKRFIQVLRLGKEAFRLQGAQEIGGEILFRLCIVNSVWILVLATEGEQPFVAIRVSGALQEGFAGILL